VTALDDYRKLEVELARIRKEHVGAGEPPDEDVVLDEMEALWRQLDPADRDTLNQEGPCA
jgi:hypothetical protein